MTIENQEVGAYEAKTNLSKLLDAVEKGEMITITRHGQPIAQLSAYDPHAAHMARKRKAIEDIEKMKKSPNHPKLSIEDILSAKHEGHKY